MADRFSDIHLKVRCLRAAGFGSLFLRASIIFTGQFKIEADTGLLKIRFDPQKSDETGADAEEQPAEETAM